jgi:hypothetical protein
MPSRPLLLLTAVVAAAAAAKDTLPIAASASRLSSSSAAAAAAASFGMPPRQHHHRHRHPRATPGDTLPLRRSHTSSGSGSTSTSTSRSFPSKLKLSSAAAPISFRTLPLGKDADGKNRSVFKVVVDLPRGVGTSTESSSSDGPALQALLTAEPVLSGPSELVEIKYRVPFELSVEPIRNLAVCTQDGPDPATSEKKGDVLRFASQWTLGLPRQAGLAASAAAFSGSVSWQSSMFDVMRAVQWEQVVLALVSNTIDRTNEVILIFERPISEKKENEDEGK